MRDDTRVPPLPTSGEAPGEKENERERGREKEKATVISGGIIGRGANRK